MNLTDYLEAQRLAWSERQFLDAVIEAASASGWLVAHFRPAQTEKGWRTPMQGHPGFPDLVLARDGVVIFAELKSEKGRVSAEQQKWIAATHGYLWRPSDWKQIVDVFA